jgi:Mg2+ and Co2+ transporter CorA
MNNQTLFVFKKQQQEYNMARTLKKVSKQLFKASRLHKGQAQKIANYVKKNEKKKRSKSRNRKKT